MSVLDLSGLGNSKTKVESVLTEMINQNIIDRIWEKDYTVWSDDPTELSNRLGWLDCVDNAKKALPEIHEFVEKTKSLGIKNILVLGMGGSSLAPEVFSLIFGEDKSPVKVYVLDSTHPEAVKNFAEKLNYKETLYIVSTKSGGTVETLSFMKFFYSFVLNQVGEKEVGKHFAAITDPGSGLQKMAEELKFSKIFLNDPNIGGRYSALSLFGLVPAALVGVDIEKLLQRAESAVEKSKISTQNKINENQGALLGAIMGASAELGQNKLTLLYSDRIKYFGAWLEQLVAESTGKLGKGILPVDLEEVTKAEDYGKDRLFIYTRLKDEHPYDQLVFELKKRGLAVVELILEDIYSLGSEFFNWEFATALAGWNMKLQPFDQPNVESAKIQARGLLEKYISTGKLSQPEVSFEDENVLMYSTQKFNSLDDGVKAILDNVGKGSYVSIQAFVNPDQATLTELNDLRSRILKKYSVATSLGVGPRFLHSTGQLHKGDDGSGIFIQFIESGNINLGIPKEAKSSESEVTFDVLIRAQALGDREALIQAGRNVITFEIKHNILKVIKKISETI